MHGKVRGLKELYKIYTEGDEEKANSYLLEQAQLLWMVRDYNEDGTLKNDIKKIADTYNAYVNGTLEDVKGFCAVVDTEKIAEQDYILTPGRYVGVEEQEDDGEPFEEKMARLTSELSDLFKQSHKLEAEIKEKLGAIGYEI